MTLDLRPKSLGKYVLLLFLFICFPLLALAQNISLSQKEVSRIAERVFANECSSQAECLIEWNEGEDFLSLGIGHFIWYPEGQKGPFEESFLNYLSFCRAAGEKIPPWLDKTPFPACPWGSRENFLNQQKDPRLRELKEFLLNTKPRQVAFLIQRLKDALPLMLRRVRPINARTITRKFFLMASSPSGIYALVDYINFKGLGVWERERYQGQGWGLLQVLSRMNEPVSPSAAQEEFVRAAKIVLSQRVANSPPERNEQKWLAGWLRRAESYLKE